VFCCLDVGKSLAILKIGCYIKDPNFREVFMKVILKEDVATLGRMGDVVEVAPGYARNFLLPKKKAFEATAKNLKTVEHQKKLLADEIKRRTKDAEALAAKINEASVTISVQVGEEEKLFGSVTNKDIGE